MNFSFRFAACCAYSLFFALGILLLGCSKAPTPVQWPALKEMDNWAEKGEGWANEGKIPQMRKNLPDLLAAGDKLLASPIPPNAQDPTAVNLAMGDFKDVMSHLKNPALSDDELKSQVAAIHPLVAKLLESAGMPHVHEHEEREKK